MTTNGSIDVASSMRLKPVKILVVDDKRENLCAVERILTSDELEVVLASSGNEALAKLFEDEYACILLDVQMPDMDGFETATIIRNDPEFSHVPIIFVTALSDRQSDIFKGYAAGAVDYLVKPLDSVVVKSKVSTFVGLLQQKNLILKQAQMLSETNNKLSEANAELERFAAVAAHDLKGPIATITSLAEVLAPESGCPEHKRAEFAKRIVTSSKRLICLVDELLEYSRYGGTTITSSLVDCTELVSEVISSLDSEVSAHCTQFKLGDLPTVVADGCLLSRLFQNLVSNGIKYRHPDRSPTIEVSAELEAAYWKFSFRDNGTGIKAEDSDRAFEPFNRLGRKHGQEGTGIGLAICRRIVSSHGGRIWLESKVGEGTTVYFTLRNDLPLTMAPLVS